MEQPRVRDYPNELADAEHRNRPAGRRLGQRHDTRVSRTVFRRIVAMRVDENIGVDRDQSRPSILS